MEKKIELPEASEILDRLKEVYTGAAGQYLATTLYLSIAKYERKVFSPKDFVKTLVNEFLKFFEGISNKTMENALNEFVPKCIEALVDDKEFAKDAYDYFLRGG